MKILVATDKPFAAVAVEGIKKEIEAAGLELVLLEKYGEKAKLLEAVKDVEGIIVRSDIIDAEVFDAAKNLKIVVRAGAGYDNIDLAAATAHNVCVMNTPGQNSNAVAELVFGMAVMMIRNFYNGTSGTELKGKKLGIHAFGQVGRNVARIAKGFGMDVYAFDPYCPSNVIAEAGVTPIEDINELYKTCQYVSLHIPATDETKKSINYNLLKQMPKGAVLINTARKEVINEEGRARRLPVHLRYCPRQRRRIRRETRRSLLLHPQENGCTDSRSQHQCRYRRRQAIGRIPQRGHRQIQSEQIKT